MSQSNSMKSCVALALSAVTLLVGSLAQAMERPASCQAGTVQNLEMRKTLRAASNRMASLDIAIERDTGLLADREQFNDVAAALLITGNVLVLVDVALASALAPFLVAGVTQATAPILFTVVGTAHTGMQVLATSRDVTEFDGGSGADEQIVRAGNELPLIQAVFEKAYEKVAALSLERGRRIQARSSTDWLGWGKVRELHLISETTKAVLALEKKEREALSKLSERIQAQCPAG